MICDSASAVACRLAFGAVGSSGRRVDGARRDPERRRPAAPRREHAAASRSHGRSGRRPRGAGLRSHGELPVLRRYRRLAFGRGAARGDARNCASRWTTGSNWTNAQAVRFWMSHYRSHDARGVRRGAQPARPRQRDRQSSASGVGIALPGPLRIAAGARHVEAVGHLQAGLECLGETAALNERIPTLGILALAQLRNGDVWSARATAREALAQMAASAADRAQHARRIFVAASRSRSTPGARSGRRSGGAPSANACASCGATAELSGRGTAISAASRRLPAGFPVRRRSSPKLSARRNRRVPPRHAVGGGSLP